MDELEKRLKQDADRITVEASVELQRRIDASLEAARGTPPIMPPRESPSRWWFSSLTGLATAATIIIFLNWSPESQQQAALDHFVADEIANASDQSSDQSSAELPPEWGVDGSFPLRVRPALLTRSLEDELMNLQSDLEKARQNVERDVKNTF